jgi:hypothetical protein
MIKQKTVLEVVIGERSYELYCRADSPLGELHDALMQMKGYCVDRMIAAHDDEKKIAEEMKCNDEPAPLDE